MDECGDKHSMLDRSNTSRADVNLICRDMPKHGHDLSEMETEANEHKNLCILSEPPFECHDTLSLVSGPLL